MALVWVGLVLVCKQLQTEDKRQWFIHPCCSVTTAAGKEMTVQVLLIGVCISHIIIRRRRRGRILLLVIIITYSIFKPSFARRKTMV